MGQKIDGATAIGYAGRHGRGSPYFAEEGLDYRRLLDDLTGADGRSERGRDPSSNWLLVGIALFVYFALLAVLQIDTLRMAPLEPMGAFILGVICGAMTGMGFVARQRWRLYLASRT